MADSQQTIFERDQWQCGVCGVAVARGAEVGHPLEPTISVSDDPIAASIESVTTHRICNASPKIRGEYPPALRETARMTYQMLEGFAELGCGKWGDKNDCYPDLDFIEKWFEMTDEPSDSLPRLDPDEVAEVFDAASDLVRRVISATTMRLDEFDELIAKKWVGEGGWRSPDWQEAAQNCLARYVGDARNLEELSILIKYLLRTESPRWVGLAPIWGPGTQARIAPASVDDPGAFELTGWNMYDELAEGLAAATGATGYIFEMERGFDPVLAGAYGISGVEEWDGAFGFRNDALSESVRVPRMLEVVAGPVRRWLLLERLVTATYERRLLDDDGFDHFDRACEQYAEEVPLRVDALVDRYGRIPRLNGYELAAARWREAGRPDRAKAWDDRQRLVLLSGQ